MALPGNRVQSTGVSLHPDESCRRNDASNMTKTGVNRRNSSTGESLMPPPESPAEMSHGGGLRRAPGHTGCAPESGDAPRFPAGKYRTESPGRHRNSNLPSRVACAPPDRKAGGAGAARLHPFAEPFRLRLRHFRPPLGPSAHLNEADSPTFSGRPQLDTAISCTAACHCAYLMPEIQKTRPFYFGFQTN